MRGGASCGAGCCVLLISGGASYAGFHSVEEVAMLLCVIDEGRS